MPDDATARAQEQRRFMEQLPWWLNHTLDEASAAWMQTAVQRWPWAAQAAQREAALLQGLAAPEPADPTLGLQALLACVQADVPLAVPPPVAQAVSPQAAAPAAVPAGPGSPGRWARPGPAHSRLGAWLDANLGWLTGPRLGPAMALVVVAQAGALVWMGQASLDHDTAMRSTPVTEVRTLRVTPAPGLTEAQWRAALLASGARIVGGPTQLGEYWLASEMRSLDEMQAQLRAAGAVTQAEVDREGPRGR